MTQDIPNPDEHEWNFEKRGKVGIWYLDGWQGFSDEELATITEHYRERGKKDDIKATLAVFGDETSLSQETQEYMGEEWSKNGEYVDVDRIGFVSDGIVGMAVKSNMTITGTKVENFKNVEEAVEWSKEGIEN